MSETKILYFETAGGGDDSEGNTPHGIRVTLSYWHSENWMVRSHYIIHSRVMINHEIIIDECECKTEFGFQSDAKMIRAAIFRFDQLVELNPEVVLEAQP